MIKRRQRKIKLIRNPYFRIGLAFAVLAAILVLICFILLFLSGILFSKNPHFILHKVTVTGTGYWNNRSEKISRLLQLKPGRTNLYDLSLSKLKNELEARKAFGIENVEISRMLPDTLLVNITERIPRAVLYNKRSNMVIDQNGILMSGKYVPGITNELPMITGFKLNMINNRKPYGQTIKIVEPALILISLVNTYFPGFSIKTINLYNKNELIVFMPDPEGNTVKVIFPFEYSLEAPPTKQELQERKNELKGKLSELKELFKYLSWKKASYREINLLYKDQAVIK